MIDTKLKSEKSAFATFHFFKSYLTSLTRGINTTYTISIIYKPLKPLAQAKNFSSFS